MLTKIQIKEIRNHLERAQNPLFLFDNDADGLCSFLLLRRYIGRGKGVPIKSFPALNVDYFKKIDELKADYIFILDKPLVSKEFFEEVEKINIPTVWIDHHEIDLKEIPDFVDYYNPLFNKKKSGEPVTALCYQVSQRKEDIWLAVAGSIADAFMPPFYKRFISKYPELGIKTKNAFDVLYSSDIGKIAKIIGTGLKDRMSNVVVMLNFLVKAKGPRDILNESGSNYIMHSRFKEINKKYQLLLSKAEREFKEKEEILFFKYSGDLSISGELANELKYNHPDNIIVVVAYVGGNKTNLSLRGKGIRDKFLKAIKGVEGARGGGHENAVGGQVQSDNYNIFKENLKKVLQIRKP